MPNSTRGLAEGHQIPDRTDQLRLEGLSALRHGAH